MIFLQEIAACIKKKEEEEAMVYSEICKAELDNRLLNIHSQTKTIVVGVEKQKTYKWEDISKGFKFDYFEILGTRDGYISQIKLYTTHQP